MAIRFFLLTLLFLSGCPSSFARDDDAGASVPPDVGGRDAGSPDAGSPDAPIVVSGSPLARALSCDLSETDVVQAIVRHVACLDRRESASVGGFYEAWEAGLFSGVEVGYTSFEPGLGCSVWRCMVGAESCAEAEACLAASACRDVSSRCEGDVFISCSGFGGREIERQLDCGALGLGCTREGCQVGECLLDLGLNYQLTCDGSDLVACDGAVRASCPPGTACARFAVGGEVPTEFCSPDGESVAGAYGMPISCAGGVIEFGGFRGAPHRYDCVANGYAGCDEWGCLR